MKKLILFLFLGIFLFGLNNLFAMIEAVGSSLETESADFFSFFFAFSNIFLVILYHKFLFASDTGSSTPASLAVFTSLSRQSLKSSAKRLFNPNKNIPKNKNNISFFINQFLNSLICLFSVRLFSTHFFGIHFFGKKSLVKSLDRIH